MRILGRLAPFMAIFTCVMIFVLPGQIGTLPHTFMILFVLSFFTAVTYECAHKYDPKPVFPIANRLCSMIWVFTGLVHLFVAITLSRLA